MNFVFDIGNVLIDFKPEAFLRSLLGDRDQEARMNELIFKSAQWRQLDEGVITQEEARAVFCERAPADRELIERVMAHLTGLLTPIPETIALLPKIKASGHRLYFLSNYHAKLSRYVRAEFSFFDLFDGGVFSCDVHLVKPSAEIFLFFLAKYRLSAGDCLFFDDMEQNVETAKRAGMKGVLFHGARDVARFL